MKTLSIQTNKEKEVVDITDFIDYLLDKEKVPTGLCTLFVKHTTCSLTTADLDPGTDLDFLDFLQKSIPPMSFRHPHDPSHAPDHILSSIIGTSITIPIVMGRLDVGVWQRIVLVELSGPRKREIICSFQKVS